jgi:nitrogen fixation protein FixH
MALRMHWIPATFVAAFCVVVAVNGVMVYFALTTFTGVAVEAPYARGLAYNRVLAAQEQQDALDWSFETEWRPTTPEAARGELRLRLREKGQAAAGEFAVSGTLQRPLEKPAPFDVAFRPVSPGLQAASVEFPARGNWDLRIEARRGADVAIVTRRLFVP